jgi:uncharacterized protein
MRLIVPLVLMGLLCISGCSKSKGVIPETGPEDTIQKERSAKDAVFKSNSDSPIPPKDRVRFQGLAYFPFDPNLKYSVHLIRHRSPEPVRLGTNTGEIRSGLRYGYFEFQAGGKTCRLQVYRLEDAPDYSGGGLFIPFRDATTGVETYSAGRYLDLKENTTGIYDLDFNRAYNPSCAYNEEYSCPVPPQENTLAIAIRAGEKKYSH